MPVQLNAAQRVARKRGAVSLLAATALICACPASAADPGRGTAHDLYVGCHSLIEDPPAPPSPLSHPPADSSAWCAIMIGWAKNRGAGRPYDWDRSARFCLPEHLWWQTYTTKAIAYTYVAYYDRAGGKLADEDGPDTFAAAMVDKWPCDKH